jgi:hypothetical protein
MRVPKDLPRDELAKLAQETLNKYPNSRVHFSFTCAHCGERVLLSDPNTLWQQGECCYCRKLTTIDKGGFVLELHFYQARPEPKIVQRPGTHKQ